MTEEWKEVVGRRQMMEDFKNDINFKLYHVCSGKPLEGFSRGETLLDLGF